MPRKRPIALRVADRGAMPQEVFAIPLAKNQAPGRRPDGADWRAYEADLVPD